MEITSFLKLLSRSDGFGCGFFVFGCFSQILSFVFLCCLFALGLKFLHFKGPSSPFVSPKIECCNSIDQQHKDDRSSNNGLISKTCLVNGLDKKKPIVLQWSSDSANGSSCENCDHLLLRDGIDLGKKNRDGTAAFSETELDEEEESEEKEESQSQSDDEDQVFDVITLRKMVKKERKRGEFLKRELEKERRAAESAAEEAMAMLLRLRMEKNAVEMEAKQYKRIAEQKQVYDQEVIQSLQWMLMKFDDQDDKIQQD